MYGKCHCGCGGNTALATKLNHRDRANAGQPRVFIMRHWKHGQWTERPMAVCHPDRPNHGRNLCRQCYWQRFKRANKARDRAIVTDWERARYTRFLELTIDMEVPIALRQLERDVPSEMFEEAVP